MGLSTTLTNALSGLTITQSNLDVLSRNVANSGTAGYHRQSVSVTDQTGTSSSYSISTGVERAFDETLQSYYTNETSDSSAASIKTTYLNQLQAYLSKPGDPNSIDSVFENFHLSLDRKSTRLIFNDTSALPI